MKNSDQPRQRTSADQPAIQCRHAFAECNRTATHMRESFVHRGKWFAVCEEHAADYESIGLRVRKMTSSDRNQNYARGVKNNENIHQSAAA